MQAAQQEQGIVYAYQAISLQQLTKSDSCLSNY
ncbi:Uncharacterised protein [Suttonella ornithocola]|uniref:Uncharacterized protein n=1 Tax=Suttonella ornithocola TaxID=279832 RepID=A0A380MPE1_9GAMM|nr:Uncharacterised protein [Suttonella ornithocola]